MWLILFRYETALFRLLQFHSSPTHKPEERKTLLVVRWPAYTSRAQASALARPSSPLIPTIIWFSGHLTLCHVLFRGRQRQTYLIRVYQRILPPLPSPIRTPISPDQKSTLKTQLSLSLSLSLSLFQIISFLYTLWFNYLLHPTFYNHPMSPRPLFPHAGRQAMIFLLSISCLTQHYFDVRR